MYRMKQLCRSLEVRPSVAMAVLVACVVALAAWVRCGSVPPGLMDLDEATSTVVVDRRGVPLYESLSGDGTRSIHRTAEALPQTLVAATLAAEDRRFWSHPGVDPVAIARALRQNLAEGQVVEGGSTITQQVAKLLISRKAPNRTRGVRAKIEEAVLALRLEHRFDKPGILALYLNLAAYGNQIVGAGRASRAYFDRDPSMLTPAQAAFLAGLPQRPSGYNPFRHRDASLARQRTDVNRVRLAVLYTLVRNSPQDDQRAIQLFENVAKSAPAGSPVRHLAAVLQSQVIERQRAVRDEQQKADAAIQKLEALRAMERSLLRDRVRSGGGGGASGGGGSGH